MAAKSGVAPAATIFILQAARWHPIFRPTHDRFNRFCFYNLALAQPVFTWSHGSGLAFFVFVGMCSNAVAVCGSSLRAGKSASDGASRGAGMA